MSGSVGIGRASDRETHYNPGILDGLPMSDADLGHFFRGQGLRDSTLAAALRRVTKCMPSGT